MKHEDFTNKIINGIRYIRPATTLELEHTRIKSRRIVFSMAQRPFMAHKPNRHKYWYGWCVYCDKEYVVRSDYISKKQCKCTKEIK